MTFNNIKDFYSSPDNLQLNKNELKKIISNIRKEKQNEVIIYNSAKIKSDLLTRYSLEILKEREKINYKSINGYYVFNSVDIKNICDMIDKQTQKYFDIEKNIYEQIDKCTSITDFLNINYDF
jgi:recombinational DNA repair protein RecR